MHRTTEITILVVLALSMAGCGTGTRGGVSKKGSGSGNISGDWTTTLANADGSIAYQFSATFAQGTGIYLNVTNFTFTISSSCFESYSPGEYGLNAWLTPSGDSKAAAAFGMSMASPAIVGPALDLQGVLSDSTVTGTWMAGGTGGCGGNGTFSMQRSVAR